VRTVRQTIRDVRVAEVVRQDVHLEDDGGITYRSKLQVSFKYESDR
jgi:dodecin